MAAAASASAVAVALLNGSAGASATTKRVQGQFDAELSGGPSCASPVGLCANGEFAGVIKGTFELTVQNVAPSGTAGLTIIESTTVVHGKHGDLYIASTAVGNLSGSGQHCVPATWDHAHHHS